MPSFTHGRAAGASCRADQCPECLLPLTRHIPRRRLSTTCTTRKTSTCPSWRRWGHHLVQPQIVAEKAWHNLRAACGTEEDNTCPKLAQVGACRAVWGVRLCATCVSQGPAWVYTLCAGLPVRTRCEHTRSPRTPHQPTHTHNPAQASQPDELRELTSQWAAAKQKAPLSELSGPLAKTAWETAGL